MKKTLSATLVGAALFTVAAGAQARDIIQIDGSSTVFPITEVMAEEFQAAEKGKTQVTVGVSGTGGGFKKFCRGETDISNASRPIKDSERKICAENGIEFIELPAGLDALTIVVNPKNDWAQHLNIEDLKKAWEPAAQGKITSWKQMNPAYPDKPLRLFGPGTDSGTYDYFVEAVVEGKSSRGDFTASEDDNIIVQGVAGDVNSLGFFGLAYYEENKDKLKAMPISWKGADPVAPSLENAKNATYQPLSRPIFIYVSKKSADEKPYVERFVNFYMNEKTAPELVQEVGYVPLPEKAYLMAQENFKKRRTGSVFHGAEVGVGIEELLARQPK